MQTSLGGKMAKITIECQEPGRISDGFHTFDELYAHRILLFIALMKSNRQISWKSKLHSDGSSIENWFIAGMNLPTGDITYHIPNNFWDMANVTELEKAPNWDGHSSEDVIKRLNNWSYTL